MSNTVQTSTFCPRSVLQKGLSQSRKARNSLISFLRPPSASEIVFCKMKLRQMALIDNSFRGAVDQPVIHFYEVHTGSKIKALNRIGSLTAE